MDVICIFWILPIIEHFVYYNCNHPAASKYMVTMVVVTKYMVTLPNSTSYSERKTKSGYDSYSTTMHAFIAIFSHLCNESFYTDHCYLVKGGGFYA